MSSPIIKANSITKYYDTGQRKETVLEDANLSVKSGERVVLYGPSGSGKTTLLHLLAGIDPHHGGTIQLDGEEITGFSPAKRLQVRREKLGIIFQTGALISTHSVYENIEIPLIMMGIKFQERCKRIKDILDKIDILKKRKDDRPSQLSGGQQQQVAIARALVKLPKLVLADEPTSGLDSKTAESILELFTSYASDHKTAFIIVSHNPLVKEHVDSIYEIRSRKIVEAQ